VQHDAPTIREGAIQFERVGGSNTTNFLGACIMTSWEELKAKAIDIEIAQSFISGLEEVPEPLRSSLLQEHVNMALRAKKEALRAKKEVDENYHESYAAMVSEFGGIPDMPRDVSLEPHIHDGRAKSRVDHELVTKEDLAFEFNQTERSTGYRLKSFIINAQFVDGPSQSRVLSYHNEATVADYVQGAVNMCLKSMGYYKKGFLMKEMSLFSLRPDLILVKHETHGIVLIIEVKMPGDELELSEGIAKQLSDYLLIQYRLGNCTPFVLLSSYREARLCHLESDIVIDNDNDADNEHRYREIVTEAARLLHNDHDFNEDFGTEEPIQDNKPTTYSPAKVAFASNSVYLNLILAL